MFGLPKNAAYFAQELWGYSEDDLAELRQFVLDSYYNAFIRHLIDDQSLIGHYLERELCINGKARSWKIHAWNDYYMERDGLQVWEKEVDGSSRLIIDLSNCELQCMWRDCAH